MNVAMSATTSVHNASNISEHRGDPIRVGNREYSRGQIARGTGYTLSAISRIFSGQRTPTLRTATILAAYFGITLDGLMHVLGYTPTPTIQ